MRRGESPGLQQTGAYKAVHSIEYTRCLYHPLSPSPFSENWMLAIRMAIQMETASPSAATIRGSHLTQSLDTNGLYHRKRCLCLPFPLLFTIRHFLMRQGRGSVTHLCKTLKVRKPSLSFTWKVWAPHQTSSPRQTTPWRRVGGGRRHRRRTIRGSFHGTHQRDTLQKRNVGGIGGYI